MNERNRLGDRAACERCGQDIEWLGKPHPEVIIAPAITMTRGGWVDRGGDRFCAHEFNPNGSGKLHKPYRP